MPEMTWEQAGMSGWEGLRRSLSLEWSVGPGLAVVSKDDLRNLMNLVARGECLDVDYTGADLPA